MSKSYTIPDLHRTLRIRIWIDVVISGDFFATCGNCAPFLAPPPNTNQLTSALECDCIYDGQTYGSMFDLSKWLDNWLSCE